MKLKYEKPYIELIKCENSNFMSGSNKGKWHYTREIGGEVFDHYSDERESSNWEKCGMAMECMDICMTQMGMKYILKRIIYGNNSFINIFIFIKL